MEIQILCYFTTATKIMSVLFSLCLFAHNLEATKVLNDCLWSLVLSFVFRASVISFLQLLIN